MTSPLRLQVPVSVDGLRVAADSIHHWLLHHQISGRIAYQVQLVVEELGTNLLRHVFPLATVSLLQIEVFSLQKGLELVMVDDGPPFDPTRVAGPDLASPLQERPIGGLGLPLVRWMATRLAYERIGDRNRLVCFFTD